MRRLVPWGCGALPILLAGSAGAYPYQALRPADQVIGGPTDGYLSALHYNPAGIRLFSGSQLLVTAGARGYLGSYQPSAPLPAGFAPGQAAPPAESTPISWAASDMMIAGSWDLSTESVTLGFALYTPQNDAASYGDGDARSAATQHLATRYSAIADRTYSLRGTLAVGLRIRPWLYAGAGFQFAYTRSRLSFFRDLDPAFDDNLSCSSPGGAGCEQWSQRQLIDLDVSGWGYGFTVGFLAEPINKRLWLGLSYISPLLTSAGAEVGLDGAPQRLPWESAAPDTPCGFGASGLASARGDAPAACGAAHMVRSFPHIVYFGIRGRIPLGRIGQSTTVNDEIDSNMIEERPTSRRLGPWAVDISSWMRLSAPTRESITLSLDKGLFPPGQLILPLAQRPAVALAFAVRQLWPRLVLAQELMYESPRTDPAAVSPANLEGHKLDLSLAGRVKVQRRLWLLLSLGLTDVLFSEEAGARFSPALAGMCRQAGYDVTTFACQAVQEGWAVPSAAGSYWLLIVHGAAGLEVNL